MPKTCDDVSGHNHPWPLHPVHRLPNEILSYIFTLYVHVDIQPFDGHKVLHGIDIETEPFVFETLDQREPPLRPDISKIRNGKLLSYIQATPRFSQVIISHVCTHWRAISLSMPSLWQQIHVMFRGEPPLHRIQSWITRSREMPLYIDIHYIGTDEDRRKLPTSLCSLLISLPSTDATQVANASLASLDNVTNFLSILLRQVARWRVFNFFAFDYDLAYAAFDLLSGLSLAQAKQLQVFQLEIENPLIGPLERKYRLFHDGAPQLRELIMDGIRIDWSHNWLTCHSDLVHLELGRQASYNVGPSWSQFAQFLRTAPRLETLKLFHSWPLGNQSPSETEMIDLRSLESLILVLITPSVAFQIIRRLRLPRLENLHLELLFSYTADAFMEHLMTPTLPTHGSNAISLLSRLKVLEILGLSCSDSCMTRCYEQLTNLKTLRLSASAVYFNKKLYRNLIPTNSNEGVYLPALTTLIIGLVSGLEVRDMVARRRDAGVQLKVVYMRSEDQVAEDDTSRLVGNLHKSAFSNLYPCEKCMQDNTVNNIYILVCLLIYIRMVFLCW